MFNGALLFRQVHQVGHLPGAFWKWDISITSGVTGKARN